MTAGETPTLTRRLLRSGLTMATLGLGIHLLLPQLAGLRATGTAIARTSWWLPVVVIGLEAVSLGAYGQLLVTLLRRSGEPTDVRFVQRTVLVGNAVGRALPGGTGAAFAIVLTGFRSRGLDPVRTGTAMWGAGMLSSAVLATLLPLGVVLGLIGGHLGRVGVSAVVAALGILLAAVLLPAALHDPDALADRVRRVVTGVARGPLRRRLDPDAIADGARRGAVSIRDLTRDRHTLRIAVGWAAANWLLDVAVVAVLALTVGSGTPLSAVLIAYVIAQIVAAVPLTPGGVGIVETAMVGALVASGTPAAAATATVLGWRLISHWLPIPVGLALLPSIRTPAGSR